jgi:hypothetical protein
MTTLRKSALVFGITEVWSSAAKRIDGRGIVVVLRFVKRTFFFVSIILTCGIYGGLFEATAQSTDKTGSKLLHATLAKNKDGEPTTKFSADSAKIYAFWKGEALKAGDRIRAVWLADDVGYARLGTAKITEASVTAYKPDDDGAFALARPKGGWPAGKYRLELYVGDKLAETVKFTIEADVTVEVH